MKEAREPSLFDSLPELLLDQEKWESRWNNRNGGKHIKPLRIPTVEKLGIHIVYLLSRAHHHQKNTNRNYI